MWDGAKNGRASMRVPMRVRISKIMFIRKYMYKIKKNIITYSFTVEKVNYV